jgi:hypothetical protein
MPDILECEDVFQDLIVFSQLLIDGVSKAVKGSPPVGEDVIVAGPHTVDRHMVVAGLDEKP